MKRKILAGIFLVYCGVMLVLLFHRELPELVLPYGQLLRQQLNLVPGCTLGLYWRLLHHSRRYVVLWAAFNLVGNVALFLPLGALLPAVFPGLRRFWKTGLLSLVLVAGVETAQLLTLLGSCDIDDLLLNLLGAALGYGLFRLAQRDREKEIQ